MENIDRVANRVSLCALTGLFGGATFATYKGFPLRSTAIKVASSCAIVGTAMFGAERLAYITMKDQIDSERRKILTSHASSGLFGGGLNGYLYHKRPLRGIFFFLPMMVAVGFLELAWEQKKRARIQELNEEMDITQDVDKAKS